MKTLLLLTALAGTAGADEAGDLFEKRILPIFKSPNPSSCVDCHLAGVDLKNYILPSHEKTFLSLRDQGLVDLDQPANSKILRLISMGENAGAALINEKLRRAELEAFSAWIKASCADEKLRNAPKGSELARPKRPDAVIRHARADKVAEAFEKNVWSQRFRCSGCHAGDGANNAKLVKENGEAMTWIRPEGPEATLKYLLAGKLVNAKAPEQSLMLTKPTNQVKHGGGQKMLAGDMVYKGFRVWLEEYAKTVNDKYATAADLPKPTPAAPVTADSEIWIKIAGTPPAWSDRLLQVTVFEWDAQKKAWGVEPVAISDRPVFGKGKLWQHNLVLRGRTALPAGRYLLRVHVDLLGRVAKDWTATLGKAELVGEKEIGSWTQGYGNMTVVEAGSLKR